jgi:glycosyltransferase 2 family protein
MDRRLLWLILRVCVSVTLLSVIVARADIRALIRALHHVDPQPAALGLAVGALTVVLGAIQWRILLREERINLTLPMVTGLYFLGLAFNQLLPTIIGGDVAKAVYAGRMSGRIVGALAATLMARVIGFLALLLTSLPVAVAVSFLFPRLGWRLTIFLLACAVVYLCGVTGLLIGPALLRRVASGRLEGLGRKLMEFGESLTVYRRRPMAVVSAVLVSVVFYGALNLNFYYYGLAVHLQAPFWFYWIAVPVTSIATMLPVSLNGYGIREASLVILFGLSGGAAATSLSLSLAMEVQLLLFGLVGAAVLLTLTTSKPGRRVGWFEAGSPSYRVD